MALAPQRVGGGAPPSQGQRLRASVEPVAQRVRGPPGGTRVVTSEVCRGNRGPLERQSSRPCSDRARGQALRQKAAPPPRPPGPGVHSGSRAVLSRCPVLPGHAAARRSPWSFASGFLGAGRGVWRVTHLNTRSRRLSPGLLSRSLSPDRAPRCSNLVQAGPPTLHTCAPETREMLFWG